MGRPVGTGEQIVQQYNWAETSPSVAVIDAIASLEGLPTSQMADQLDPPLGQIIPTDALDNLLNTNHMLSVEFGYDDYHVELNGDSVSVTRVGSASD